MRVLIAEDNAFPRRMLELALQEWGYEVESSTNGLEAWQALNQENAPELALLDWIMPEMDGIEVCRKVKQSARAFPIYVILLTAKTGTENIVAGLEAGADDYISKPIVNEELRARIRVGERVVELQRNLANRVVELEAANIKLQELDRMKANFTAMLVHDLKSPLTVVRATLEMIEDRDSISPALISDLINKSNRSVDTILTLINDVMEVFRSESSEMSLKFDKLAPSSFLHELVEDAELSAHSVGISVQAQIEPKLPMISADRNKLERAFSNLLSNAIKFTAKGGSIIVEAEAIKGTGVESGLTMLLISITDSGEGIPAESLPYIFEPYKQVRSKKSSIGVGLGLAIVKRIIAAHSGNISVHSQVGVGSCFKVTLPTLPN